MPTPSSDTRRPAAVPATVDPGDTLQFRAATLEEAIALAESSLGARVRVVAANRIRRGGIGGFFAADLGVEVTVALDDETMEQALERLVADAAGAAGPQAPALDERMRFEDRLAAQEAAATARPAAPIEPVEITRPAADTIDPVTLLGGRFDRRDDEPAPAVNPVLAEVVAAIVAEAAEKQALAAAAADTGEVPAVVAARVPEPATPAAPSLATWTAPEEITPPVPVVPPVRIVAPTVEDEPTTRPVYTAPPTMLKVEQIMAELSAITAEPVFGERSRARVARPARREPIVTTDAADSADVADVADAVNALGAAGAAGAAGALHDAADSADLVGDHRSAPTADATASAPATAAPAPAPTFVPTLPPRASDVARRASDAAHAARARFLTNQPPDLVVPAAAPGVDSVVSAPRLAAEPTRLAATPTMQTMQTMQTTPLAPSETATRPVPVLDLGASVTTVVTADERDPEVLRVEALIEDDDLDGDHDVLHVADDHRDDHPSDQPSDGARPTGAAPSQRQVELAVAATDQLIESLKREDGVKRLSVRVVLRTGDHREVEAEAEWEAS